MPNYRNLASGVLAKALLGLLATALPAVADPCTRDSAALADAIPFERVRDVETAPLPPVGSEAIPGAPADAGAVALPATVPNFASFLPDRPGPTRWRRSRTGETYEGEALRRVFSFSGPATLFYVGALVLVLVLRWQYVRLTPPPPDARGQAKRPSGS